MIVVLEKSGRLILDDKDYVIPEVQEMVGFRQKNPHHPEDDLMEHVSQVVDNAKQAKIDDSALRDELLIAAVFHDISKPICWQVSRKNPEHRTFFGHDKKSAEMFVEIDKRYGLSEKHAFSQAAVEWLIAQHIRIMNYKEMKASKRKLLEDHLFFKELTTLRKCDTEGRKVR